MSLKLILIQTGMSRVMRSKFERMIARQLEEQGAKYEYEAAAFEYWLPVYQAECGNCGDTSVYKKHFYTPDFFLENGVILEVKGRFTAKDRKIAKAMREYHPTLDIRYVFYADNKLSKASSTRYSGWCEKGGFKYAFKQVPEDWLT